MFNVENLSESTVALVSAALKRLAANGVRRVAVFGTGQHSAKAEDAFRRVSQPEIVAFIRDNAEPGEQFAGWPCIQPEKCPETGAEAVIVSTDAYEKDIFTRWAGYFAAHDIPLLGLYYCEGMLPTEGEMLRVHNRWDWTRNAFRGKRCHIIGDSSLLSESDVHALGDEYKLVWGEAVHQVTPDRKTLIFLSPGQQRDVADTTSASDRVFHFDEDGGCPVLGCLDIPSVLPKNPLISTIAVAVSLGFRPIYVTGNSEGLYSPAGELIFSRLSRFRCRCFTTDPVPDGKAWKWYVPFADSFTRLKPWHVVIQPTNRCNMKCSICPGPKPPYADMSLELFEKILRDLRPYAANVRKLELCGGIGEPTLNRHVIDMIRMARGEGYGHVGIFTNGITLDRCGEDLLRAGLTHLSVSFYGSNPDVYRKYHQTGSYSDIRNSILNLLRLRDQLGSALRVSLRYSPMDEDREDLDAYVDQWRGLVDEIVARPLHNCNDATYNDLIHYSSPASCTQPNNLININAKGDVVGCCINTLNLARFGNVAHQSIRELYEGEEFEAWRANRVKGSCRDCTGANPPEWIIQ